MSVTTLLPLSPSELLIEDLLHQVAQSARRWADRRAEPRYPLRAPMSLGVRAEDGQFCLLCRAWATDISASGLGVLCERELSLGQVIYADLRSVGRQECIVPLRMAYCLRVLPNTFRAGGPFLFDGSAPRIAGTHQTPFTD